MSVVSHVVRSASLAFALKATGAIFSFLLNLLLARLLGADGTGLYYLALTAATVSSVIARLGLDKTLLKHVSIHGAKGEWSGVWSVYRTGIALATGMSLVLTASVVAAAPAIAVGLFDEPLLVAPLRVIALGITPHALMVLHTEMLTGLREVRYALMLQGFGVPLLSIPILLALAGPLGVVGACLAYVMAALFISCVGAVLWRRATPRISPNPTDWAPAGLLLKQSLPLLLAFSMYLVLQWTDTVMLGIWTDARTVGLYGVALRVATLITFVILAIDMVTAPQYSALYEEGAMLELGELARKSCLVGMIAALPMITIFLALAGPVLALFGPEFVDGAGALKVLATTHYFNVATGSVTFLLIASGRERVFRNIMIVVAATNVTLNYFLIPSLGILGAAAATGASFVLLNAACAFWVFRTIGVVPIPVPCVRPFRPRPPSE